MRLFGALRSIIGRSPREGVAYERLDQLTVDLLLGVRPKSGAVKGSAADCTGTFVLVSVPVERGDRYILAVP